MRKRLIPPVRENDADPGSGCLDLHQAAIVELTSEADSYPIEEALSHGGQCGWRAGMPGAQTIRLLLDEPQTIQRIRLVFEETTEIEAKQDGKEAIQSRQVAENPLSFRQTIAAALETPPQKKRSLKKAVANFISPPTF